MSALFVGWAYHVLLAGVAMLNRTDWGQMGAIPV